MHIKRLVLENFKSYKERTVLEFDAGHNVIVGKNGSGKSNTFFAIRFVLSQKYQTIRAEDRKSLLHEGSARSEVLSASVEIVFCNKDGRMPVDREEVSLKRTIGMKKDEFFLNGKHATKQDVESLLESAGLSRANPYNIVAQGRVTQIIKMTDEKRLRLFKELAGTSVYDERRKESIKIMKETESRTKDIQKVIDYIEKRLQELTSEKEELRIYEIEDKKRRAIEYCLHRNTIVSAEKQMSRIEGSKEVDEEKTAAIHQSIEDLREKIQVADKKLQKAAKEKNQYTLEKTNLDKELVQAVSKHQKWALEFENMKKNQVENETHGDQIENALKKVKKDILEQEEKLKLILPEFVEKSQREEKLQADLSKLQARRDDLYAKQARGNQFRSKKARNKHIDEELAKLSDEQAKVTKTMGSLEDDIQKLQAEIEHSQVSKREAEEELQLCQSEIQQLDVLNKEHNSRKASVTNKKKQFGRILKEQEQKVSDYAERCQALKNELRRTMSGGMWDAYQNCQKIVKEHGIQGVYGTIMDLISCDEMYHTCVEVTAGNRMLYWVVANDDIAGRIIQIMQRKRLGRVTLLPLNRLSGREHAYPESNDAFPMVKQLQCDHAVRKAVLQVFGNTLICRDLETAGKFSSDFNLDAITLEGDSVNRRGAMRGGYQDKRKQRLAKVHLMRQAQTNQREHQALLNQALQDRNAVTKELFDFEGEGQKIFTERAGKRSRMKELLNQQKSSIESFRASTRNLELSKKNLRRMATTLERTEVQIKVLKDEKGTEIRSKLSSQEQEELEKIMDDISQVSDVLGKAKKSRLMAESAKSMIEDRLNTYLLKKKDDLSSKLTDMRGASNLVDQLETVTREREEAKEVLDEAKAKYAKLERALDDAEANFRKLDEQINKDKEKLVYLEREFQEASKSNESRKSNQNTLQERITEAESQIRGLGALPEKKIIAMYNDMSKSQLMKKLSITNGKLKKFTNVNKKALDEYQNFTDQKAKLIDRKKSQDDGKRAIEKLIDHLDAKKVDAIDKTFKSVEKQFKDVFKEIVPTGEANFEMIKNPKFEPKIDGSEKYQGVNLRITFDSAKFPIQTNTLLSGGQQTCVALALILAIQRADPSPFYLFDEIDAALDQRYRTNIAGVIKTQSQDTQFICTTFRPEMLEVCTRFFGVTYKNKVSHVRMVSKEDARTIIREDEQQI